MAVYKTPKECLDDLNAKEIIFIDYETSWKNWNDEIEKEKKKRTDTTTDINTKDELLHSYIIDEFTKNRRWKRIGNCTMDNQCKLACEVAYSDLYTTTPMGKGFAWFAGKLAKSYGRYKVGDDSDCWRTELDKRRNYCWCQIPSDDVLNTITSKKREITDLLNTIKNIIQPKINEISIRMPKPKDIELQCCLNQINCDKGKCEGNIQICRTTLTDSITGNEYTQTESNNYNNIITISNSIDDILKEINSLSTDIYNESYKVYSIINQKNSNIKEMLDNLNSINEQIKIYFKKVGDIIKNIIQKKNDAVRYNDEIRTNSSFKLSSINILDLINKKINNINNTVLLINNNNNYVKTTVDSIEKQNNDINSLNLNKTNIVNYIILINDDIKIIDSLFESARELTVLSDIDLKTLYNFSNNAINLINNINISKNILNEYYTTFTNLFNNFPKNSDYYNIVLSINKDVRQRILNINNNITEVNNTIKNINDIYLLKKEMYEIELIKQEELLIRQEQLLLDEYKLKLLEEENKNIILSPLAIENNTIPIIYPTYINPQTNIDDKETDNTLFFIVIPIAAVVIIGVVVFLIWKHKKRISGASSI